MSAYAVFNYTILDRSRIDELGPISQPVVEQYGGEITIASFVTNLENAQYTHMVVYKFPSMAAAESWYTSEENQKVTALRKELVEGSVVLVPAFNSSH